MAQKPHETERARWRGEEPYSRTATTPDNAGIAKVSCGYGPRSPPGEGLQDAVQLALRVVSAGRERGALAAGCGILEDLEGGHEGQGVESEGLSAHPVRRVGGRLQVAPRDGLDEGSPLLRGFLEELLDHPRQQLAVAAEALESTGEVEHRRGLAPVAVSRGR